VWIVSYVESRLALASVVEQQRHRRVRHFADELSAARFVQAAWAGGRWLVTEMVEVRREAGVWVPLRPF
jgi:hypothetical protein